MSGTIKSNTETAEGHARALAFSSRIPLVEAARLDNTPVEYDIESSAAKIRSAMNRSLDELDLDAENVRSIAKKLDEQDQSSAQSISGTSVTGSGSGTSGKSSSGSAGGASGGTSKKGGTSSKKGGSSSKKGGASSSSKKGGKGGTSGSKKSGGSQQPSPIPDARDRKFEGKKTS